MRNHCRYLILWRFDYALNNYKMISPNPGNLGRDLIPPAPRPYADLSSLGI